MKNISPLERSDSSLKSKSYLRMLYLKFENLSSKIASNFRKFPRERHSGAILIEAAITLPIIMYIMLFSLELVRIHLLQIAVDKICAECVYHLCSERTVSSFDAIFAKYRPSYLPVGYIRYYCRVYSSIENMMNSTPYGGESIYFPYPADDNEQPTANAIYQQFGKGDGSTMLKKYGGSTKVPSDIGTARISQLRNGVTKGYAFVLTVSAKHKFSSAFVEKLFSGGTNTNRAGYYILWSRGSGIVN